MKMDQFERAKSLLSQAMGVAANSLGEGRAVQEAKSHMKQAIRRLDDASKTQTRKIQTQQSEQQKWWGNVVSGTANMASTPVAQEAYQKTLTRLDLMIAEEQKKLEELENKDINNDSGSGSLLTD